MKNRIKVHTKKIGWIECDHIEAFNGNLLLIDDRDGGSNATINAEDIVEIEVINS